MRVAGRSRWWRRATARILESRAAPHSAPLPCRPKQGLLLKDTFAGNWIDEIRLLWSALIFVRRSTCFRGHPAGICDHSLQRGWKGTRATGNLLTVENDLQLR